MTRERSRLLTGLALTGAFLAASALIVLPGLHGAHLPYGIGKAAIQSAGFAPPAASVSAEPRACVLCAAVSQARIALAPPAAATLAVAFDSDAAELPAIVLVLRIAAQTQSGPRAPPTIA